MNSLRVVGLVLLVFWLVFGPLMPEDAGEANCCCAGQEASSQGCLAEVPVDCSCAHTSCRLPGAAGEIHAWVFRGRSLAARRVIRLIWLALWALLLLGKWSLARPRFWSRQTPWGIPQLLHWLLNLPPPFILF